MTDVEELLKRQSRWQKSRTSLSWAAKIRMAAEMREDVATFRRSGKPVQKPATPPTKPRGWSCEPSPSHFEGGSIAAALKSSGDSV